MDSSTKLTEKRGAVTIRGGHHGSFLNLHFACDVVSMEDFPETRYRSERLPTLMMHPGEDGTYLSHQLIPTGNICLLSTKYLTLHEPMLMVME